MSTVEQWSVWTARVYFEDQPEVFKVRPVVIYGNRAFICTALKVTSREKNDRFHIAIRQWAAAGLDKPSWIDISKVIQMPEDQLIAQIGTLDTEDILEVLSRLHFE